MDVVEPPWMTDLPRLGPGASSRAARYQRLPHIVALCPAELERLFGFANDLGVLRRYPVARQAER
jgi:hypothetical protein